jgi:hypothetical protein
VRQWRTFGPEAGSNGGRLKNRTERNSVESFLSLKMADLRPFIPTIRFSVR